MRAYLLALSLVGIWLTPTHGQWGGEIRLSTEPTQWVCEMAVDAGPTVTVYVIHDQVVSATAAAYRVSTCNSTLVYIGQTVYSPYYIGDVNSGIAVTYEGCQSGPYLIQSIEYAATGLLPVDSGLAVKPWPLSGEIEGVDCNFQSTFPDGGVLCIGCVNVGCKNILGADPPYYRCTEPVPVENRSWGKVKALYR